MGKIGRLSANHCSAHPAKKPFTNHCRTRWRDARAIRVCEYEAGVGRSAPADGPHVAIAIAIACSENLHAQVLVPALCRRRVGRIGSSRGTRVGIFELCHIRGPVHARPALAICYTSCYLLGVDRGTVTISAEAIHEQTGGDASRVGRLPFWGPGTGPVTKFTNRNGERTPRALALLQSSRSAESMPNISSMTIPVQAWLQSLCGLALMNRLLDEARCGHTAGFRCE